MNPGGNEPGRSRLKWKCDMKSNLWTTVATYFILALAGVVSFILPDELAVTSASGSSPASKVRLAGIIRDFKVGHPDFGVTPVGGNGHYAGNVSGTLDASGRPGFTGPGFRVATQWRDKNNRYIAPHMYYNSGVMLTANPISVDANAVIDTWNSTQGPYGGANVGGAPTTQVGGTMPIVTAPTGMGASVGNRNFVGVNNINANLHCGDFVTAKDTVINIMSSITIYCEGNFALAQNTRINIINGSTLRLYVRGQFAVNQGSQINMNTFKPSQCRIYNLGITQMEINQNSSVCAHIISPNGNLHLAQNDHLYGTFVGRGLRLDQSTGLHWDGIPVQVCGVLLADLLGTPGVSSTGAISSAASFSEWFTDTLGVNMSARHSIELVQNGSGIYEYMDDAFHPINGMLFGNQGQSNNNYFTYTISTTFLHEACQGKFFEFQGADDAWLYVNGRLAMDLGGVIPGTPQFVDFDRLGLADGQTCTFEFFYAQRQGSIAMFRFRTNVELAGDQTITTVSASAD